MKKIFLLCACLFLVSCATQSGDDNSSPKSMHNDSYQQGMHYLIGRGVSQNYSTAVYWFQKAANRGNPYAQSELGYLYSTGRGVPQDYSKAIYWYQKAANQGLASAQYNLGLMYLNGIGTPVNKTAARQLFQEAAARGFDPAKRILTTF